MKCKFHQFDTSIQIIRRLCIIFKIIRELCEKTLKYSRIPTFRCQRGYGLAQLQDYRLKLNDGPNQAMTKGPSNVFFNYFLRKKEKS